MIIESKVTIAGFKFGNIEGKRILQFIYMLDTSNGKCIPVTISDENNIDKGKLVKELVKLFRKKVNAIFDIQDDLNSKLPGNVIVNFVGFKNVKKSNLESL
jgi:hypothetical protein